MHTEVRALSVLPFTAQTTDFPASFAAGPIAISLSIRFNSAVGMVASHWRAAGSFPCGDFKEISITKLVPRDAAADDSCRVWATSIDAGKAANNQRKQKRRMKPVRITTRKHEYFRRLL